MPGILYFKSRWTFIHLAIQWLDIALAACKPLAPMLDIKTLLILTITFFLQSCGSLLDISGKGTKATCLKLSTDNLTVACNCSDKQMVGMTIYSSKNSKEHFGAKASDVVFNPAVNTLKLPISRDSADKCFLQIEIHLTNSHHRESYYFKTKPGDFSKTQNIYSRYVSH